MNDSRVGLLFCLVIDHPQEARTIGYLEEIFIAVGIGFCAVDLDEIVASWRPSVYRESDLLPKFQDRPLAPMYC